MSLYALLFLVVISSSCAKNQENQEGHSAPSLLIGSFIDDYDVSYQISSAEWNQKGYSRHIIVKWNNDEQYLIAKNDSSSEDFVDLWTRIDWMELDMPPFAWAFCISSYNSASAEEAEKVMVVDRSIPIEGCNGFPFSRMKSLD